MAVRTNPAAKRSERELVITHLFDAPRTLLWKLWTDPEHIKHWWGPDGFTNTIDKMEVKEGGVWEFVMHGPDGTDYKNKSFYTRVVEPELLMFDHVVGPRFQVTVTFTEQGKKTLLTWRMVFESAEHLDRVIQEGKADRGLEQNIARLEDHLKKVDSGEGSGGR